MHEILVVENAGSCRLIITYRGAKQYVADIQRPRRLLIVGKVHADLRTPEDPKGEYSLKQEMHRVSLEAADLDLLFVPLLQLTVSMSLIFLRKNLVSPFPSRSTFLPNHHFSPGYGLLLIPLRTVRWTRADKFPKCSCMSDSRAAGMLLIMNGENLSTPSFAINFNLQRIYHLAAENHRPFVY